MYVYYKLNDIGYLRNCIARVFLDRQEIQSKSVIDQIISYVDDHLQEDISRKTLGELFYLHPNSIGRLFRQETGQSLGQYLISKRMNIAKKLLEETKLPVNVISMKLGYDNFSYFTKCFKEYAECSPSDYRKRYRNYPG